MRLTKPGKLIISVLLIIAFASAFTLNPYAANSKAGEKFIYAVEPGYDFLGYLTEGMAVTNEGVKIGYVGTDGKVLKPQWDQAHQFKNGVAVVELNGQCGLIDKSGKYVIKPQWTYGHKFNNGYAVVANGLLFGMAHISGKEIMKPKFSPMCPYWYVEDKVKMLYENKLHTYDSKGNHSAVDYPIETESKDGFVTLGIGSFHDGLARINSDGKIGYIDINGNIVLPLKWDFGTDFNNGAAVVHLYSENGYTTESFLINTKGEVLYKDYINTLWVYYDGLYTGRNYSGDLKYYAIDESGKLIYTCEWEDMKEFSDGYAPVQKNGKWGYADKAGNMVIEPQWENVEPFINGHAIVVKDGKYGIIKLTEGK